MIYLGLHNTATQVVKAAVEEDVDAVGISFLSGQHRAQTRLLTDAMKMQGLELPIICGGVIPDDDARELREMGISAVIRPGTLTEDILALVKQALKTDNS